MHKMGKKRPLRNSRGKKKRKAMERSFHFASSAYLLQFLVTQYQPATIRNLLTSDLEKDLLWAKKTRLDAIVSAVSAQLHFIPQQNMNLLQQSLSFTKNMSALKFSKRVLFFNLELTPTHQKPFFQVLDLVLLSSTSSL